MQWSLVTLGLQPSDDILPIALMGTQFNEIRIIIQEVSLKFSWHIAQSEFRCNISYSTVSSYNKMKAK